MFTNSVFSAVELSIFIMYGSLVLFYVFVEKVLPRAVPGSHHVWMRRHLPSLQLFWPQLQPRDQLHYFTLFLELLSAVLHLEIGENVRLCVNLFRLLFMK